MKNFYILITLRITIIYNFGANSPYIVYVVITLIVITL